MPRSAKVSSRPSAYPQGTKKRTIYKALKQAGMTDIGFRLLVQQPEVAKAAARAVQRHVNGATRNLTKEIRAIAKKHGIGRNELKSLLRLK